MKRHVALLIALNFCFSMFSAPYYLHSDNGIQWKVNPQEEVGNTSGVIQTDYDDTRWVKAIVPGTVFASYVAAGLEQDPNFGDNIAHVDRSKYDRSFWYRTEFTVPQDFDKNLIWLCFNGVNRKAEIYLNGTFLGILDGFMHRGRFNVTDLIDKNGENTLAVLVHIPRTPLSNCGSPTYLCSGGWDWMPYVPGLNSGITDKVYLSNTGAVTIVDPWIRTDLPNRARAELSVALDVKNNTDAKTRAVVTGVITPGDVVFTQEVELEANTEVSLQFDKRYFPQLCINSPRLWWPNGYGEPNLYNCRFEVKVGDAVSEIQDVTFGIRKYTYDKKDNTFHIYVNGVPVFVKGANWGMPEYMLRCRGEEYDLKVDLHRRMNFNMIRNWLGVTTDEEFYQACDRHGLMVWDDFWINSNPNLPYDIHVFNFNMVEKIKRLRNHPCIAVWCGDNESNPQPPLEGWMAENIRTFDGGDRYFQPNSHAGGLTGSGKWKSYDPRYYFLEYPDGLEGDPARGWGFRTEIGTAVMPNYDSFIKFMPEENWWPRDEMWNFHYFGPNAANADANQYDGLLTEGFGTPDGIEDYCRKAQLVNIQTNKAMYEGWLDHMWNDASGIMIWMGQSSFPSMVWQTYDYYYDLTGAYWGAKSACEPLHIMWNPVTEVVKIANTTASDFDGLKAEAKVFNLDGKEVTAYTCTAEISSPSNTVVDCFAIPFNTNRTVLSTGKPTYASSSEYSVPSDATDGKDNTRWSSRIADNEWLYVDLGCIQPVGGVRLNWEASFGKSYKIQVSDDAVTWDEVYKTDEGREGIKEILFPEVNARYVRMFGIERGWWYGYSLWAFDVLGGTPASPGLTDTHFIRLRLTDRQGNLVSENFYWRGNDRRDFTALNMLEKAQLKVTSTLEKRDSRAYVKAVVSNPKTAPVAFAVHIKPVRTVDGERILPVLMSDNYFTLMPGEKRTVEIEFDEKLLGDGSCRLIVEPYNR